MLGPFGFEQGRSRICAVTRHRPVFHPKDRLMYSHPKNHPIYSHTKDHPIYSHPKDRHIYSHPKDRLMYSHPKDCPIYIRLLRQGMDTENLAPIPRVFQHVHVSICMMISSGIMLSTYAYIQMNEMKL
jgi:hypothetical protein